MKIKKYFVGFVASTMLVSTCYCIKPVEAIDFSKDEAKYMSLCASGKLTNSNKKTCEEFNSYLKAKNKKSGKYDFWVNDGQVNNKYTSLKDWLSGGELKEY